LLTGKGPAERLPAVGSACYGSWVVFSSGENEMRSRLAVVALVGVSFLACSSGQAGPTGPAGLSIGAGGTATTCQPGARFCDGTGVWECSRVGLDAVLVNDCGPGNYNSSANNPFECSTTHCAPYDYGACCNSRKAVCTWNLTSPLSSTGSSYANSSVTPRCYSSAGSVCAGTGQFYMYWSDQDSSVCQPSSRTIYLYLNRATLPAGFPKVITLPNAGVNLYHYGYTNGASDGTKTCSAWTGTVTWTSDAPTWSATINATCNPTTIAVAVQGTFNGDL
jgi:hypothetical protein